MVACPLAADEVWRRPGRPHRDNSLQQKVRLGHQRRRIVLLTKGNLCSLDEELRQVEVRGVELRVSARSLAAAP